MDGVSLITSLATPSCYRSRRCLRPNASASNSDIYVFGSGWTFIQSLGAMISEKGAAGGLILCVRT